MSGLPVQFEVDIDCQSCDSTGIFRGFSEPAGVGVVCLDCEGNGFRTITIKRFLKRKLRTDVNIVRRSRGRMIAFGTGPTGGSITYEEFLEGKMPG
jgi:hypothetical protein